MTTQLEVPFLQETAEGDTRFPQVAGSLIGAATADALGWITEFVRGVEHLRQSYNTDWVTQYRGWQKTVGGRFNTYIDYINKGEYSDDTQLTISIARSLNADGSLDTAHFIHQELPMWLDYARGAGSSVTAAARAAKRKTVRWNSNFYKYTHRGQKLDYRDAGGNGAAMRVSPIALANPSNIENLSTGVWESSIVTHGHPRAIVGGLLYGHALRLCLNSNGAIMKTDFIDTLQSIISQIEIPQTQEFDDGRTNWNNSPRPPFEILLNNVKQEVITDLAKIPQLTNSFDGIRSYMEKLGCFRPERRGSGTATVLAAISIFLQAEEDVEQAITWTINQLGSDTDTIGSFVGGLCGASYGYDVIPHQWTTELQDYYFFLRIATEITRITEGRGLGGYAFLPDGNGELATLPKLLELLQTGEINKGERVYHPVLGSGWVESVDAQSLRRKDGGRALLVSVNFDMGQSCKFKHLKLSKPSHPYR